MSHKEHSCHCGHHHEHSCGCSHDHDSCGCSHDHHDSCGCGCGHDHHHDENNREGLVLILGAALFALGIAAQLLRFSLTGSLLFAAAYLLLGLPILANAARNLVKGRILDENFLMGIATLGALAIGEFAEAVGVMLFYRVGEYFEHRASAASRKNILSALDLRPDTVTLENGAVIPAGDARPGDILLVRPGDRVPLDGRVLSGESALDTSAVTGESLPVAVGPGSALLSGCVNTTGLIKMVAEKPLGTSTVSRILESVEQAAARKPKMDRFITRFSRVYTPIVVALAAATAIIPSLITGDWRYWVYTALSFLVMSCPCALVISVPLAFFSGIGMAGRKGILFKGGSAMEALCAVKAAALDKTGTLTRGEFKVLEVSSDEALRLCAICEQNSSHPIARSILAAYDKVLPTCDGVQELAGLGLQVEVDGRRLLCGSAALMAQEGIDPPQLQGTAVYVAEKGTLLGWVRLGDALKAESPAAIARLKKLGITPVMLTGDRQDTAQAIAKECGIEAVHAGLLPQEKLAVMEQLRAAHGPVLFVGDGINDAPVLAGADVGGAMGSGADAAMEAADVVFMTSRSDAIPQALSLARTTRAIAWQNVVFAIGIKVLVMLLGLLGFANMWLAVFADSGVAMLCVLNSIRLLFKRN